MIHRRPQAVRKRGGRRAGRGWCPRWLTAHPEAELPLQDTCRAALAEVMRRCDEKQQAQRAGAEAHARIVLGGREQAGVPLLPEQAQG